MSRTAVDLFVHIVFCTKKRAPYIHPSIESRLHSYLVGIAQKRKTKILRINGMEDHIHILINLHPSVALSDLIKELKAYSTSWMKKNGYSIFAWQRGYGGFFDFKIGQFKVRNGGERFEFDVEFGVSV